MSENLENLIFERSKKIPSELSFARERDAELLNRLLNRLSNSDAGLGYITSYIGRLAATLAQQQGSLDKMSTRMDRIERRLELA